MSAELLTISISANETKRFERAGAYVEIIDAPDPIDIALYDANGSEGDAADGALSGFYLEGKSTAFTLKSATTQRLQLLLTDGRGGSRRQPGNVRVIDNAVSVTQGRKRFFSTATKQDTPSAQSVASLLANGKTVAIRSFGVLASTAGDVLMALCSAPGTAHSEGQRGLFNCDLSGPDSTCLVAAGSATSGAPTEAEMPGYKVVQRWRVTANQFTLVRLEVPIIIRGTQVLSLCGDSASRRMYFQLEVEEID